MIPYLAPCETPHARRPMRDAPCERLYPQLTPDASSRIETNLWLLLITEPCLAKHDPDPPTPNHTTKANRKHRIELYEYDFESTKPSVCLSPRSNATFSHTTPPDNRTSYMLPPFYTHVTNALCTAPDTHKNVTTVLQTFLTTA
jgi:hypothetical protein